MAEAVVLMCPEWAAHRHHRHHVHPYLGLQQGRELGPWRLVPLLGLQQGRELGPCRLVVLLDPAEVLLLGLQQGRELGPWRLVVVLLDRGLLLSPHLPRLL